MEELKLLIEMVRDLPQLALWVIVIVFGYKVVVIGSIYGIIRFIAERTYSWAIRRKSEPEVQVRLSNAYQNACMGSEVEAALISQLNRCTDTAFIHMRHVEWLRSAIDMKKKADHDAEANRDRFTTHPTSPLTSGDQS